MARQVSHINEVAKAPYGVWYYPAGNHPASTTLPARNKTLAQPFGTCKLFCMVYNIPMSPYKKAEAACNRLKKKYGVNRLASLCMNGRTGGPISRQAVEAWEVIPLVHVRHLAELENCRMDELRPDLWTK